MTYIPIQAINYEQLDVLNQMLTQLKIMLLHLQSMSDENITEEDVE